MAKTPQKIYFDMQTRNVILSTGLVPNRDDLYPGIKVGQKDNLVNIQLVNGDIDTVYEDLPFDCTAQWLTDNDYDNPTFETLTTGSNNWTLSGSGTSEYYYTTTLTAKPEAVYANSLLLTEGTLGSLTASQWAYGDNDTIGSNRVYVRLSDSTDPDTKTNGYLQYIDSATYTPLFIMALGDKFNTTDSWYDEVTQTYRTPVVTNGEITFVINANTTDFIERLDDEAQATGTFTEIQFLSSGDAEVFEVIKFTFRCLNRLLPNPLSSDDPGAPFYNKTESDIKYIVNSTTVTINNAATYNFPLFYKTEVDSCLLDIVFSDTVYQNRIRASVMIDDNDVITPYVDWFYNEGEQITCTYTFDLSGSIVRFNLTNSSGNIITATYQVFDLADSGLGADLVEGIVWMGAWSGATTYNYGEAVSHGGSSYVSNVDGNLNHEPPNASYWDVLATGTPVVITANRAAVSDANGEIVASSTTDTELSYVHGVTSAIQTQLDTKVDENVTITGATKTKITYDAKGLVTGGADATTADIADSTDRRYCTDAQKTVIGNTSGTNTGDVTLASPDHGLGLTNQIITLGTPSTLTTSTTNAVTTTTHTHAITPAIGMIGNGSAQYQIPVTGATPFAPVYTTATGTGTPVLATAPTFVTNISTPIIKPTADSTTAVKITKSDGTTGVIVVDTTNSRLGINTTPLYPCHITSSAGGTTLLVANTANPARIEISGAGNGYTYGDLLLSSSANDRGIGFYQFDAASQISWFIGRPYDMPAASWCINIKTATASFSPVCTNPIGAGVTNLIMILNSGNIGVGTVNPTARIHYPAGTAAAGTGPFKMTQASAVVLTSPEAGVIECNDGDDLYYTIKTGAARKGFIFNDGTNLTSGKIPVATTNGRLIDVTPQTVLTTALTSITHTAPGTPDYAIQDLTDSGGFGFVTKDEGNTVLSVILNLQTRVNELETKLIALKLLAAS